MHDYLRSVGLKTCTTRKQLHELTDWVLQKPGRVNVVPVGEDGSLAVAERDFTGGAGISVVGEIDEDGALVPEYYFPYISSGLISSEAEITYEHQKTKSALIGMCEDYRLGMALIFTVRNLGEVLKNELNGPFALPFTKVAVSALCSDAMVLLPVEQTKKVEARVQNDEARKSKLMEEACNGSISAIQELTNDEMDKYRRIMDHLHDTDIYTLVDHFFMPHGMESDQYYFMGTISGAEEFTNELTDEKFWRITLESNGIPLTAAVNAADLQGIPAPGYRLKCHAWILGELKR